ncbi:MAG: DUF3791 domain-containing protein [Oscillospiraceae bacterium]|nr:DUF3791 domain-containing protein [Oscillospiraceae bacterium]
MGKRELDFAVFCIENIAEHLNKNGAEVYNLLTDASDILDGYIIQHYEPLHTQGREYIVNELVEYMEQLGVLG